MFISRSKSFDSVGGCDFFPAEDAQIDLPATSFGASPAVPLLLESALAFTPNRRRSSTGSRRRQSMVSLNDEKRKQSSFFVTRYAVVGNAQFQQVRSPQNPPLDDSKTHSTSSGITTLEFS